MALDASAVQELYVAYLNRPADPAGLDYWTGQVPDNFTLDDLRYNLVTFQPEYQDIYANQARTELITTLYQNMFGRDPESAGLAYWSDGEGSAVPAYQLPQLFISAASDNDRTVVESRVEVADYYTANVADQAFDQEFGAQLLASVQTAEDVTAAKQTVDTQTGTPSEPTGEPTPDAGESGEPQTPPPAGGGGEPNPAIPESQILLVQGGEEMETYFDAAQLADYQAVRFSNVQTGVAADSPIITLEGVTGKRIFVESSAMKLNLNGTQSAQVELNASNVHLMGDTIENSDGSYTPTGLMTSLDVITMDDSTLDLAESASTGLTNVTLTGAGKLTLTGSSLAPEATSDVIVDASGMGGSLTVGEGVLDNVASFTAGAGSDNVVVDDFTTVGGNVASLAGGEGTDTLIVASNIQTPDGAPSGTAVEAMVSGFETVAFDTYAEGIDAQNFQEAETFAFAGGGEVLNVAGQTIEVTGLSKNGSGPIIRDSSGDLKVVSGLAGDQALKLGVYNDNQAEGGTLNLSGTGTVMYEESGREFANINASGLEDSFTFTGADYLQQTVTLSTAGEVDDTIYISDVDSVKSSDPGDATTEISPTSTVANLDIIQNFDFGNDQLVDDSGSPITLTDVSASIAENASLDQALAKAAEGSSDGSYVSFELNGSTYVYADTQAEPADTTAGTSSTVGASDGDFAIQLMGVQSGATETVTPETPA